jgi:hypothetical protein
VFEKTVGTIVTCARCKRKIYGRDLAEMPFKIVIIDGRLRMVCRDKCKEKE